MTQGCRALVDSPQPQRATTAAALANERRPAFRQVLLEVYARRFYRTRELRGPAVRVGVATTCWAARTTTGENKHIQLVVAYARLDELPDLLAVSTDDPPADPARPWLLTSPRGGGGSRTVDVTRRPNCRRCCRP